jgi:hypothetical protein
MADHASLNRPVGNVAKRRMFCLACGDANALYLNDALTRAGIAARIAQKSGKSTLFQGGPR